MDKLNDKIVNFQKQMLKTKDDYKVDFFQKKINK
jgi:hypothetical protein